jgi:hypothetical protein
MDIKKIRHWYKTHFEKKLKGQYITYKKILPLLEALPAQFELEVLGYSVEDRPIPSVKIGKGKTKVLLWAQMHGDESTATRVLFDFFNFLQHPADLKAIRDQILAQCTLVIIPILNPDGAYRYTRINALNIDLNRDAKSLQMPESNVLKHIASSFKPHFGFNLHDQGTQYNVAGTKNPATLSFLAPAADIERSITSSRKKAMQVIAAMNNFVQQVIPKHIGRYDDAFCNTCFGDSLQQMGIATILIEAGHSDWKREKTREYYFYALLQGLNTVAKHNYTNYSTKQYFAIPNNEKLFFDVIYRNVRVNYPRLSYVIDIAVNFNEYILGNKIARQGNIAKIGDLSPYLAHIEEDVFESEYYNKENPVPKIGALADFELGNIQIIKGLSKKTTLH